MIIPNNAILATIKKDPGLAKQMIEEGFWVKNTRNATVVRLGSLPSLFRNSNRKKIINCPLGLMRKRPRLVIESAEVKNVIWNVVEVIIVCSICGKRLKPYYIPRHPHINDVHAKFVVPRGIVLIYMRRYLESQQKTMIVKYNAMFSKGACVVDTDRLWEGDLKRTLFPQGMRCFSNAIEAAQEKLLNLGKCKKPIYSKV